MSYLHTDSAYMYTYVSTYIYTYIHHTIMCFWFIVNASIHSCVVNHWSVSVCSHSIGNYLYMYDNQTLQTCSNIFQTCLNKVRRVLVAFNSYGIQLHIEPTRICLDSKYLSFYFVQLPPCVQSVLVSSVNYTSLPVSLHIRTIVDMSFNRGPVCHSINRVLRQPD